MSRESGSGRHRRRRPARPAKRMVNSDSPVPSHSGHTFGPRFTAAAALGQMPQRKRQADDAAPALHARVRQTSALEHHHFPDLHPGKRRARRPRAGDSREVDGDLVGKALDAARPYHRSGDAACQDRQAAPSRSRSGTLSRGARPVLRVTARCQIDKECPLCGEPMNLGGRRARTVPGNPHTDGSIAANGFARIVSTSKKPD